ncbi:MAG: hypothetical protein J5525_12385 [Lachnospiraceae bacterium]|nr:hypothetical protein [Lachnospiraceae bacterium]
MNEANQNTVIRVAMKAFSLKDEIEANLSGGVNHPREVIDIESLEKPDQSIYPGAEYAVNVRYTYSPVGGIEGEYHDTRAGKIFTETYIFDKQLKLSDNPFEDVYSTVEFPKEAKQFSQLDLLKEAECLEETGEWLYMSLMGYSEESLREFAKQAAVYSSTKWIKNCTISKDLDQFIVNNVA